MARKLSSYNKFVKKFSHSHKGLKGPQLMKAAGSAWRKSQGKSHKKSRSHKKRSHKKSRKN